MNQDDDYADEWEYEDDEGYEEPYDDDYDDGVDASRTPSRRRPPSPLAFETFVMVYCIAALTFVRFHPSPSFISHDWRLFGWFGTNFVVLFCIPALIVSGALRIPLSTLGLRWGKVETWLRYMAAYGAVMIPVVLIASRTEAFHSFYPQFHLARIQFGYFILSAVGWLFYFFAWEWFFRGLMLFTLAPRIGGGLAILVQMIPFVMMHYRKVEMEAWSSVVAGIALGLMAFRGKSFIGCWLLHWAVMVGIDLAVLLWPLR